MLACARMTAPRPVIPGRFLFVTRTCTQRQFLLRPDAATNNAFAYCLAEAAQRFKIDVVLSQMMSNHHHTMLYDPHGNEVEFREHFHKMMAKSQNALRGRWENLWSSEETCVVDMEPEDVLDKLVYIATNPVKDGLVERVRHWPGPKFVRALLTGKPITARRPRHFFRKDGVMRPEVELVMKVPDHVPNKPAFLRELRRRIKAVEDEYARERQRAGRGVVGRQGIEDQSWRDSPTSERPHRKLRPRVAARSTSLRIDKLEAYREWLASYRAAREGWRAGKPVEFPFGTYWLKRFAGVRVKPPPTHC